MRYPSQHIISRGTRGQYIITGDVNVDYLVQGMSAKLLCCKISIFTFVINMYLIGRYLETMQISCFSSYFHPLILASISGSCLKQLLL